MARDFDGTADYLYFATSLDHTTKKHAISLWVNPDATTTQCIVQTRNTAGAGDGFSLAIHASDFVLCGSGNFSGHGDTTQTGTFLRTIDALTTGVWAHVCANVAAVASSVRAASQLYVNGVSNSEAVGIEGGVNKAAANARTAVGSVNDGSSMFYNGRVAYLAIWEDYSLTAADAAALAKGYHPFLIAPAKLKEWKPLGGVDSTVEKDLINGNSATLVSAPPQSNSNPLLIHPWVIDQVGFGAAASTNYLTGKLALLGVGI